MAEVSLSASQSRAVSFDEGPLLVKAGAGSGKTRVLTERIKRLCGRTQRKLLAITFTNKAAEEIWARLSDVPNISGRLFVGTFHSFCQQVLENHGKHIGFLDVPHIFEDEADRLKLVEQAIQQTPTYRHTYGKQDLRRQKDICVTTLNFISEVKRQLQTEEALIAQHPDEDLILLFRTYQDILTSQNAIDFDDLILLTYTLFTSNPKIAALYRRTYEYICIDEAQDLNYAQYQLLRALTEDGHSNVMLVGDPNQSIFAFAGSSSEYMNAMFVEDFRPTIIELKENYRSSRAVLGAAQKIIADSCDLVNIVIPGVFEIHMLPDEEAEARWIVERIKKLVEDKEHKDIEGFICYEKIAVLARNRYVLKHLSSLLTKENIPFYYKVTPGAIKFESRLMGFFDMALRVRINPKDSLHWHRLLDHFEQKEAKSLQDLTNLPMDSSQKRVLEAVLSLNPDGGNFRKTIKDLYDSIEKNNLVADIDERGMVLNDISELLEHWRHYAKRATKESLQQFKSFMALGKTHPLAQPKGITLSTVHTMKGQEYEIVFLMGMDDETFPDYRAVRSGGKDLEQEKNNAYVAFTRSKRFLYVTWPAKRCMPWGDCRYRSISRFLKEFE